MSTELKIPKWVIILFIFILILGIASPSLPDMSEPASWLVKWTNWVGTVAGIIAGTRVLWSGGNAAREYAIKQGRANNRQQT